MEQVLQLHRNNRSGTDQEASRLCQYFRRILLSTSYPINLYFSLHLFFYPVSINLFFS